MAKFSVKHSDDDRHFGLRVQLLTKITVEVTCSQFLSVLIKRKWCLVEIMPVSEEDVKRWFNTAQKWGRANSAEKCRDTFQCLEELAIFLKELEKILGELVWGNLI